MRTIVNVIVVLVLFVPISWPVQAVSNAQTQLTQALQHHQGQVIYLDFWASWCLPCRKSFPWLNKVQSQYGDKGLVVISINLDAELALATEFLVDNPANFSVIYDPQGDIASHFNIKGMPSSVLIDHQGKPVQAHTGFFNNKIADYEQEIASLLYKKNL